MVGLVQHGDLDRAETHDLLLHEVFQTAGAGDDDVDAALQRLLLRTLADTAEHGGDAQPDGLGQGGDGRGDLGGQLAGGGEHEAARQAGAALVAGRSQAGDERKREGDGLAAARASAAEEVTAGERIGQGVALDGERLGLSGGGENGGELGGNAEIEEGRHAENSVSARERRGIVG